MSAPTMSPTIGALAKALAAAQGAMKPAAKDATNPHFKSKYADLASIWEACRAPLAANGLSVVQTVGADGEAVLITTLLLHESGEWVSGATRMLPRDDSPQAAGSAVTYGRRYALAAIVGVAPDDDDGNAAQGDGSAPRSYRRDEGGYQGNGRAPASTGATSSTPTTGTSKSSAKPTPTSATAEAPPDPSKAKCDAMVVELAKLTSKDFAREVWSAARDHAKRLVHLTTAQGACAEIVRVMGDGRGAELITDIIRRSEPIAQRVATLVAASTGEVVARAEEPPF